MIRRTRLAYFWLRAVLGDAWLYLTERVAVEWRRAFPVPYEGAHTEAHIDMQWADDLLEPLPVQVGHYRDPLRPYIDAAWQATGTTAAEYWASVAPPSDLPGSVTHRAVIGNRASSDGAPVPSRAGEPCTPNQAMNLWQPNDVIPPRIAATLARMNSDDTAVEVNHATLEPYIVGLAGGDPFDGLGQDAWLDRLFAGAR